MLLSKKSVDGTQWFLLVRIAVVIITVRCIHTEFRLWEVGLAHCNTEDDEYEGYFIPKATIILQNNWYAANLGI
jgi:hypothetical protein